MILASAGIATSLGAACSTERDSFGPDAPASFQEAGAPDVATSPCGYRCSADLKKVIQTCGAEGDKVVAECGPEQGCGVDGCVDACESAALSKGSVGCSFWTLPAEDIGNGAGGCFAAMLANTWDRPVTLKAEIGSEPLDVSGSVYTAALKNGRPVYTPLNGPIPVGEVALVFLSQLDNPSDPTIPLCPSGIKPALSIDPIRHGTSKTRAFHLETDAPISAYSIFPYGGAESYYPTATLLLPVSSWDTNYIAVQTGRVGINTNPLADWRTLQIVANEDGTEVSMRPVDSVLQGTDVAPAGGGVPQTWTLSRGQVLQISQLAMLSGSPISSNKPVGVFGGSTCIEFPNDYGWCDLTQQQIPALSQWGTEYALVPYEPRVQSLTSAPRENVPWLFVGAADGTVLTYDPARPPGAPDSLSAGQVVVFMTDERAVVKSQDSKHPFYAGVQMTGANFGGGSPTPGIVPGDPDFVNVVPSDQFLSRYVFFADYTFPNTTLVVVRRKTADGFRPVTLDCAGELTNFNPLGAKGEYEYAFVGLTKGAVEQSFPAGKCGYGRHEASSDGPFSLTVWGIGKDASYGYAGGAGSRPVNDVSPIPVR
ncbi:hypothetical protein AKJ09_10638 [Labilithrix luteola]|uniref:IgGFc-binding protein N-terminal domain-containing protein n=1 Tax=Labilithrix luteola TaxID=1391654 RepID=A0A0K1QEW4_9BACT|nr:hypothetical protein AKJ09_10638 [Labilithrix luteola]